jgi:hypothetical protein
MEGGAHLSDGGEAVVSEDKVAALRVVGSERGQRKQGLFADLDGGTREEADQGRHETLGDEELFEEHLVRVQKRVLGGGRDARARREQPHDPRGLVLQVRRGGGAQEAHDATRHRVLHHQLVQPHEHLRDRPPLVRRVEDLHDAEHACERPRGLQRLVWVLRVQRRRDARELCDRVLRHHQRLQLLLRRRCARR